MCDRKKEDCSEGDSHVHVEGEAGAQRAGTYEEAFKDDRSEENDNLNLYSRRMWGEN